MAGLSLLFTRTRFLEQGGSSCCPWDLCGTLPLGYERFPTDLAALPAPSRSLPPTGPNRRMWSTATLRVEASVQRKIVRGSGASSLGRHPTLVHTSTHLCATFPAQQLLHECITSCSLTSLCLGYNLLSARCCLLKHFCSIQCRDPAKPKPHSKKNASNR